jgi:ankyrin repeat domain-containing protein 50
MLWVSADPGCGKSVLVKYLADSILATTESRTTCYFFFKDDFEDQRSAVSALCCILHQLFKQNRILLSENILEQFEVEGEKLTSSFSELWAILLSAANDKNAGEIICLLDAIDECEDQGRSQLAQALCKLYGTRNNFNLKFLLTSRPYGGIRRGFQPLEIPGLPVIHLSGESDIEMMISREIDVFIKARVQDIGA